MSAEFRAKYQTGDVLYTQLIRGADGQVWNGSGWETPVTANWATYTVAMTEQSTTGYYYGDMPAAQATGLYDYFVYLRAGGSPAASDNLVLQGTINWTGAVDAFIGGSVASVTAGVDVASFAGHAVDLDSNNRLNVGYVYQRVLGNNSDSHAFSSIGVQADVEAWGGAANAIYTISLPNTTVLPMIAVGGFKDFTNNNTAYASVASTLFGVAYVTGDVVGKVLGTTNGGGSISGDGVQAAGVSGNVVGNLGGNVSGSVVGNLGGNVGGNVVGNLGGNVGGDLLGKVLGTTSGGGSITGDGVQAASVTGNVGGSVGSVTARVTANTDQINGVAPAATALAALMASAQLGTVDASTSAPSTNAFETSFTVNYDTFQGGVLYFTSGVNKGIACPISSATFTGNNKIAFNFNTFNLTIPEFPSAPVGGDSFVVFGTATVNNVLGGVGGSILGNLDGNVAGTVVLDATQPNYAPAKAGDKMDLIDAPNAVAITAIQAGLSTYAGGPVASVTDVTNIVVGGPVSTTGGAVDHVTLVDTTTDLTNGGGGGGGLDAAGVRAAVGLATANLDTQLAEIEGETDGIATLQTTADTIVSATNNLPADPAGMAALASAHGAGSWATATGFAPASTALSTATWTAARAGYLDNLNVGAPVASQADVQAVNQSASKHLLLVTVGQYERPESGTTTYTVECRTFAAATGAAVNADTTPTLTATGAVSGSLTGNLSAASNPATGVYRWTYSAVSGATQEQVRFDVSATISSSTFTLSCYTQVVDVVSATWTSTDATHLTAVFNKLPTNNIADETLVLAAVGSPAQAGVAVVLPAAPTDWLTAAAVKADAVAKIQAGLSTYAGGDTAGTSTLLTLLTSARAGNLDNLGSAGAGLTAVALASNGLDAVVVEAGLNARQAMSLIAAALAGVLSGAAGTTITIKGAGTSTVRIVATVDSDGDRQALTLSPPA